MSDSLRFLKSKRIAEGVSRVEQAREELSQAKTNLHEAKAELKNAPDAQHLKDDVIAKQSLVREVGERLAFENDQLNQLLNVETLPWYVRGMSNWNWSFALFAALGGIVLWMLYDGLQDEQSLLVRLAEVDASRGLITFLITLITVTIALILTLSTIVSSSEDRAERFKDGKDLLFALIGVLGAIVGFYFGQAADSAQPLTLSPVISTNSEPRVGDQVSLIGFVSGGAAPYNYSITFSPEGPLKSVTAKSSDGVLRQDLKVGEFENTGKITYEIRVTDSEGQITVAAGNEITVQSN